MVRIAKGPNLGTLKLRSGGYPVGGIMGMFLFKTHLVLSLSSGGVWRTRGVVSLVVGVVVVSVICGYPVCYSF